MTDSVTGPDSSVRRLRTDLWLGLYVRAFCWRSRLFPGRHRNLLVFAAPRGGSTWLQELFLGLPRTFPIFEPLNHRYHPEVAKVIPDRHPYVPAGGSHPALERHLRGLLDHTLPHKSLFFGADYRAAWSADTFVLKFVFGNMLLPWIVERFDVLPVFLVRHPCAVVASQLRHRSYVKDIGLNAIPPERLREVVGRDVPMETLEERLAATWAAHAVVPLRHPENDRKWITVTYEDLVVDGPGELRRIFGRLGLELPAAALEGLAVPSQTAQGDAPTTIGTEEQLAKWRQHLDAAQVRRVLDTVRAVGVTAYGEDPRPDRAQLRAT